MDPRKKQAIAGKIAYVITHLSAPSLYHSSPQSKIMLGLEDGNFIYLVGETVTAYESICDKFASEASWKKHLSRSYIHKGVNALLKRVIKDGEQHISDHIDAFITECENVTEEHHIYLPLDNLQMAFDRLEFGKITLINMRGNQLTEFRERFREAIPDQLGFEQILTHWQRDALPVLTDKVVAFYAVSAEAERAQELAEEALEHLIEILRYFIFQMYRKQFYIDVGLRGNVRYGIGESIIFPSTYSTFRTSKILKSPQRLIIGLEVERAMREFGIFALADMLEANKQTTFSKTLFAGVHWMADALVQSEPANEYLCLTTCLETFLNRGRGDIGSITNAVATGIAWVLGHNHEDRINLHKEAQQLYGKRSSITHGEQLKDIEQSLKRLREIACQFMIHMVHRRNEFRESGRDGLHAWIDQGPLRPQTPPTVSQK